MIRAALCAAAAVCLFAAGPASAGTILSVDDETELAAALAEAADEQGICYGWDVYINGSISDTGSSTGGPGIALDLAAPSCARGYVALQASVSYVCDSCEGEDSATVVINSNLPNRPTKQDLEDLGFKEGQLVGDEDDSALASMVGALPLLAADRGNVPIIPAETATAVPPVDRATGTPGSDLLRDRWFVLVLCLFLLLAGPGYYLYKRAQTTTRAAARERDTGAIRRHLAEQPTTTEE